MPIEIRELVIRATVEDDAGASAQTSGTRPGAVGGGPAPGAAAGERSRLIAEIVDHVMDVLRERRER